MGISGVGAFPVQSGGSLIFFQLFRCRNLALNRGFSYFLVVGIFLYLGGVWTPHVCMPPVCLYTLHMFICPLGVYTPPIGPMLFCAPAWFWSICMLWRVVICFKCVLGHIPYTTPIWGASPLITPPHFIVGSLCIAILRDISILCGLSPSIEGFWGVPPSLGEV